MTVCLGCGDEAPEGALVCPSCGAQLAPTRRAEERRVVTTLFCDLVGFTALSERNDPEDVNALLRRYYGAARRVIESYGGIVEKFIGDAVVAAFGVPTLHEDDPERAVRAGLRLIDEIDALPGIGGQAVEVRVGVNTGDVLVALDVDPNSGEGFLIGDAVNTAARLQSAAPPMAVAVGAATHAATERIFTFEACHPVTLKGKAAPVEAWIASASLARTGSELRSFTTSFVGRERELAELAALLDEALAGHSPRFALIVGEPGIGKSRLLAEFCRRLDDQPTVVTWRQGRCLPYGSGVTFWALSEIVKAQAGILESDGVARAEARLESVLPEGDDCERVRARLRPLLGLEAEEASREENFAVWRAFLEGLAAAGPAVLVVEDLHWADEGMLAFMDYLGESSAAASLLVLATARPETLELTGAGAGFMASARRLSLGPLSGDETAQLVLARLGAKSLPAKLQATLLERSGGNPLFAEELTRLLEDRDLLVDRGGQTVLREGVELPLPDSIGALIAARLDLLSAERKALLSDAAVVGRTFWVGAVAAVGALEPAQVLEGLIELVAKELVRPVRGSSIEGETEFLFVHALVRDVAYGQLTRADLAQKHAALARWLEQRSGGRTEDLAEILAYHYGTALDMATACGLDELEDELGEPTSRYLALAAGRAAPLDATAAEQHFAQARKVAEEAARPRRRWLLSRRSRRTLRRRAPLLVGAAAVIAVAAAAAFIVWAVMPSRSPSSAGASGTPKTMTAEQIANKYGPGVARITVKVPDGSTGRVTWKTIVGSGFAIDQMGTILTNFTVMYRGDPQALAPVNPTFGPLWARIELWGPQGQYSTATGFCLGVDANYGTGLIAVDPSKVHLYPLPIGDPRAVRKGASVVTLARQVVDLQTVTGRVSRSWSRTNSSTGNREPAAWRVEGRYFRPATGGPVFDTSGRVIGLMGAVPWWLVGSTAGNTLAINQALGIVRWSMRQYRGTRVWLGGVQLWWLRAPLSRALALPRQGELVEIVDAGSASAGAGLRGGKWGVEAVDVGMRWQFIMGGDLIVAVDGKPVTSDNRFIGLLNAHKPGDTVTLGILRGTYHPATGPDWKPGAHASFGKTGMHPLTVKVRVEAFPYMPFAK